MPSAGVQTDRKEPLTDTTVMTAPPPALVVILVQMCGTLETSEEATLAVVSAPRPTVPPLPEKVPSQAVALAWEPTLKVIWESTDPETVTWSSSDMKTVALPGSSFTQVMV